MPFLKRFGTQKKTEPACTDNPYGEEVLNANWLPRPDVPTQPPEEARTVVVAEPPEDLDAYLRNVYSSQE